MFRYRHEALVTDKILENLDTGSEPPSNLSEFSREDFCVSCNVTYMSVTASLNKQNVGWFVSLNIVANIYSCRI